MPSKMGDIIFRSDPCGASSSCGVYLITLISPKTKKYKVVYVGSSKNIKNRVLTPSHPYRVMFNRFSDRFWVATEDYETDDYLEIEKQAIKFFNPVLNIQHKNR